MLNWKSILPKKQNDYKGSKISYFYIIILGLVEVFRGCVHSFTPDGGSGIIAGLPLSEYSQDATRVIINFSGVFGTEQLFIAVLIWTIIIRYREWIPYLYILHIFRVLLGLLLFITKPLPVVPPGEIGLYVQIPFLITMFLLSLYIPKKNRLNS